MRSRCLMVLGVASVAIITILSAILARGGYLNIRASQRISLAGHTPELPLHIKSVRWKDDGVQRYGLEEDQFWDSMIPLGGGSVHLDPTGQRFQISVFHQYRCLNTLRRWLITQDCDDSDGKVDTDYTLEYCLNYLRQSLLCNSDITVEPVDGLISLNGKKLLSASGVGVSRSCKDVGQLREFLQNAGPVGMP